MMPPRPTPPPRPRKAAAQTAKSRKAAEEAAAARQRELDKRRREQAEERKRQAEERRRRQMEAELAEERARRSRGPEGDELNEPAAELRRLLDRQEAQAAQQIELDAAKARADGGSGITARTNPNIGRPGPRSAGREYHEATAGGPRSAGREAHERFLARMTPEDRAAYEQRQSVNRRVAEYERANERARDRMERSVTSTADIFYTAVPLGYEKEDMIPVYDPQTDELLGYYMGTKAMDPLEAQRVSMLTYRHLLPNEAASELGAMSPEELAATREGMIQSGLMSPDAALTGRITPDEIAGYIEYRGEVAQYPTINERQQSEEEVQMRQQGYMVGSEKYLTASDAKAELLGMSLEELAQTKVQLIQLGYLDPDAAGSLYTRQITKDVIDAFATLVGEAQLNDMHWGSFKNFQINSGIDYTKQDDGGGRRGSGGGAAANTIRLTAPDDLRAIANQVAQQRLGRFLTDAELNAFVTSYQAQETAFQQAYYANQAVVTEAPTAEAAAGTFITSTRATDADIYAIGGQLDTFLSMIGGQ